MTRDIDAPSAMSIDQDGPRSPSRIASRQGRRWAAVVSGRPRTSTAVVAVALSTLVASLLLIVYQPLFMVNDDVAMESFANGDYTGATSAHLVFIGAIVGVVLALLYRVAYLPWFGLLLYATQVIAFAGIAAVAIRRRRAIGAGPCTAAALSFVVFVPLLTLRLSFTAAATLSGILGVILITLAATVEGPRQKWCALAAALAFVMAANLRWDAFVGTVAVFAPILLIAAIRVRWRKVLVAGAVLAALVGLTLLANVVLASRGEWSEFTEFNAVRGQLHGSQSFARLVSDPDGAELQRVLDANSWTREDLQLFDSWFFDNPSVYTKENLRRLSDAAGQEFLPVPLRASSRLVTRPHRALLICTIGFAAVASMVTGGSRRRLMVPLQLFWALAMFTATASRQRFPDRVAFPMFFGLAIVLTVGSALLTDRCEIVARLPLWTRRVGTAAALIAGSLLLVRVASLNRYDSGSVSAFNTGALASFGNQMRALDLVDPNGRFVFVGPTVETELTSPLTTKTAFKSGRLLGLGWPTFSPLYELRKSEMGLGRDLMPALAEQSGVYLVVYPGLVAPIIGAYDRWYQMDVDLVDVGVVATGARIYDVTPRQGP